MLFIIALVAGLLVGGILLALARPRAGATAAQPTTSSVSGWMAFAMSLAAAVAFAVAAFPGRPTVDSLIPLAIGLPAAALVLSVGSLLRGERRWTNWLGLAIALAPSLFWVAFVIGELIGPAH